jgi:hypothetical protein
MGFLRGLLVGGVIGAYAAQNYDLPNVLTMGREIVDRLKDWEANNRKAGEAAPKPPKDERQ